MNRSNAELQKSISEKYFNLDHLKKLECLYKDKVLELQNLEFEYNKLNNNFTSENKKVKILEKELKDLNFLSKNDRSKINNFNATYNENLKLIKDHILGVYNQLVTGSYNNDKHINTHSLRLKLLSNNNSNIKFQDSPVETESEYCYLYLENICDTCDDIIVKITENLKKVN